MKKLLIVLLFVATVGCAGGVWDFVSLNSIYNLNMLEETQTMIVQLKGTAGKTGQQSQNVIVELQYNPDFVSINTDQFLKVKTFRIKQDILEDLNDIYKSMQR